MPLVTRLIETEVAANHGKIISEHTLYVHPRKVKPTDKVVDPGHMSRETLHDLAVRFPAEYQAAAIAAGIDVRAPLYEGLEEFDASDPAEAPDEDEEIETAGPVVEAFSKEEAEAYAKLNAESVIEVVSGLEDIGEVMRYQAHEAMTGKRRTVLRAIDARLGVLEAGQT